MTSPVASQIPNRHQVAACPPQPTATTATLKPYSMIRSEPMIHATSSPSVA